VSLLGVLLVLPSALTYGERWRPADLPLPRRRRRRAGREPARASA
jgi:hypothetical protein